MKHAASLRFGGLPLVFAFALVARPSTGLALDEPIRDGRPKPRPGAHARLHLADRAVPPMIGVIRAIDDSSITLELRGGGVVRTSRVEMESLDLRVVVGHETKKGAVIGASVGFLTGVAVLIGAMGDEGGVGQAGVAAAILCAPGAGLGALVGRAHAIYSWVEVARNEPARVAPSIHLPAWNQMSKEEVAAASVAPRRGSVDWGLEPILDRRHKGAGLRLNVVW